MHVVTVIFEVDPARIEEFRTAMLQQARNSLEREDGCRQFDVCADPEHAERIFLYEIYDDAAAFDLHLARAHFHDFDETVRPWVRSKEIRIWQRIS